MTSEPKQTNPTPGLLEQREQTHGSFNENSYITQEIRSLFRNSPGFFQLSYPERQSMDEIALKLARLCTIGNAGGVKARLQHWTDVRGYTDLALRDAVIPELIRYHPELSTLHTMQHSTQEESEDGKQERTDHTELSGGKRGDEIPTEHGAETADEGEADE